VRLAGRIAGTVAIPLLFSAFGCESTPEAPLHPAWADVAPIFRGQCVGCHGWTASDRPPNAAGVHPPNTGGSVRLDFFDATAAVCGDAALALDQNVVLAGATGVSREVAADVVARAGAQFPAMPPQPTPALEDWQLQTILRWTTDPVKGPPPTGNRPPTIAVTQLPAVVGSRLAFTAIADDPDGDSVLGVVEANGVAFLMNRPGAFDVSFDTSTWTAGQIEPHAILCDGWTSADVDLGPIVVQH